MRDLGCGYRKNLYICMPVRAGNTYRTMKQAQLFRQYIWIINTLRLQGAMTLSQLNKRWVDDCMADGNALARSSFNRYREAIQDLFGVVIECREKTYHYYISNPRVLSDDGLQPWLLSTMTVHGILADSAAVKDRLVLEDVPAGMEYLSLIVRAIKSNRRLLIGYQKFSLAGYEKVVCPYALKLFHQRWYLLARTADDQMRIYALDRMTKAELTTQPFRMPRGFSPKAYFSEYFGVLTMPVPLAHVVVRAYATTPDYLRTLPLHHTQREIGRGEDYADFSLDLRPTADFLGQLLSHGARIEVLEPESVRQQMAQALSASLQRYGKE